MLNYTVEEQRVMNDDVNEKKTDEQSEELCECGTPKDEVCLIPGTEACMACHELCLMEQTGRGVVHVDTKAGRAFVA